MSASFLDTIDLSHLDADLRDLMSDGIVQPCLAMLGEAGLNVTVSRDLRDLADFWDEHKGEPELIESPIFHPDYHPEAVKADTLGFFLEKDERRLGTCWYRRIRLLDQRRWQAKTLAQAFEDMSIFYAVPHMIPAGETCICKAPIAHRLRASNIAIGGGVWLHPSVRRKNYFSALP